MCTLVCKQSEVRMHARGHTPKQVRQVHMLEWDALQVQRVLRERREGQCVQRQISLLLSVYTYTIHTFDDCQTDLDEHIHSRINQSINSN